MERIELSTRYLIEWADKQSLTEDMIDPVINSLHDKMTQCRYHEPITSFELQTNSEEVFEIDVMKDGRAALEKANQELGLIHHFVHV